MLNFYRFCILFFLLCWGPLSAQDTADALRIPGELLIQLAPDYSIDQFFTRFQNNSLQPTTFQVRREISAKRGLYVLQFDANLVAEERLLARVRDDAAIVAAQFNFYVEFRLEPNDPEYGSQWGLQRIQAPEVWDVTTGGVTANGDTIVVAILDSGYDVVHEDMTQNLWFNQAEVRDDAADNDNNGLIDDYYGWNYEGDNNEHPTASHGQSVAGIIGAEGNNGIGVTGINWNCKLMLFTIDRVDDIVASYNYVIDQRDKYNTSNGAEGAFVVATNASFGLERQSCSDQPVWGNMYDLMGTVGVLTGAGTANSNFNVEEVGDMPTTCDSEYLLTVLNSTNADEKYSTSAYGTTSIDMGAPGAESYTTKPNNRYGSFGGNSAAAPHMTGTIALLYSLPCNTFASEALTDPATTALTIRNAIINGVDTVAALADYTVTGGRLNIYKAMEQLQVGCEPTSGPLAINTLFPNPAVNTITVEFETPDFEEYDIRVFNSLGQVIYQDTVVPNRFATKRYNIRLTDWPIGIYHVSIRSGKEVVSGSFVRHP